MAKFCKRCRQFFKGESSIRSRSIYTAVKYGEGYGVSESRRLTQHEDIKGFVVRALCSHGCFKIQTEVVFLEVHNVVRLERRVRHEAGYGNEN